MTDSGLLEEVRRDYGNGMRYKGEVRKADGVFEGKGTLWVLFAGGRRPGSTWGGWSYSGTWKDGKKHGTGLMRSLPPMCHFSDVGDGIAAEERSVPGDGTAGNGEDEERMVEEYHEYEYSGGWRDDKMEGVGTEKSATGVYNGSWRAGLRHGLGTFLHRETGDKYVGQWENGLENGQGKEVDGTTGDVLEGLWMNGLLHGYGRQVERGGNAVYEGDWVEGVREGKGVLMVRKREDADADGGDTEQPPVTRDTASLVYDGEWQNDKWHGMGILRTSKLVYEGSFLAGKKHGHGRQEKAASSYEGDWEDGVMHGVGCFRDALSGDEYNGGWQKGKRSGTGTLSLLQNGERVRIEGMWEAGRLLE